MKKFIALIAVAFVAICLTSCNKEYYSTLVEWGFAKDTNSEITNGLETEIASARVIFAAFDLAFLHDYTDLAMPHQAMMEKQQGKQTAVKNAKATAEKAHSMIEEGHTCPVDMVFVVRIKYNSDTYETVWSHDYRK